MLRNFLFDVCGCKRNWSMKTFARDAITEIAEQVGDRKVILGIERRCGLHRNGRAHPQSHR